MLPIRLGTVNARGPQDMIVLTLSDRGRVEPVNYRTRGVPTGTDIPLYVKADFTSFYRASLSRRYRDEARNVVELTNWSYDDVKARMASAGEPLP